MKKIIKRPNGFYWVEFESSLIVAQWNYNLQKWFIPGRDFKFNEEDFTWIYSDFVSAPYITCKIKT